MKKSIYKKNNHLFIIGGQRCGTTSILNYLQKYNDIIVAEPQKPEPKYFLNKNLNYTEYLNEFFIGKKLNKKILVDKSTSYLETIAAASNIKKIIPDAKILILLRNPTDRCISNYFFSKKNKYEKYSLEKALKIEKNRKFNKSKLSVSPYNYFERGKFVKYLNLWFKIFNKSQIKVIILENLINNTQVELRKLCEFLNIKFNNRIAFTKKNSNKYAFKKKLIYELNNKYKSYNNQLIKKFDLDISYWQ